MSEKTICTVCGHVHATTPARCPVCGGAPEKYQSISTQEVQTLEEVRGRAREKLRGYCAVYPYCDGGKDRVCQREAFGRPIGMGGTGMGHSFSANVEALQQIKLKTSVLGKHVEPDTHLQIYGRTLDMPIMGASTSGLSNYNNAITEDDFCTFSIQGCQQANTLSWRGDTYFYTVEDNPALDALERCEGHGMPIFKPRSQDDLKRLIERAEKIGCPAVGVDLDGCGSTNFLRTGQRVYRKSQDELAELVRFTNLPFIAKGIMTTEEALACAQTGVHTLVISNHGGRVLDSTPGVAEVLPDIVQTVGKETTIIADGGVRTGYDVLKLLAIGAKAVLVGRDLARAAVGGASQGVSLHLRHLERVLKKAMLMTGCENLECIDSRILV